MSWKTILKISTKDAIADARRHMSEDDKEPKMELSNLNPLVESPAYEVTMKSVMKGLYRGHKVMTNALSLIPDDLKVNPVKPNPLKNPRETTPPPSAFLSVERVEVVKRIKKLERPLSDLSLHIGRLDDALQEAMNAEEKLQ